MDFGGTFVPYAGQVGVLAETTEFFLLVSVFALAAGFVFFLATRNSVAPEHRTSSVLSAIIVGVAAVSYFFIRSYYHSMLEALAQATDPAQQAAIVRVGYLAIGQYRYMDWAITTPLLLLKTVLVLKVKPSEAKGAITLLLLADFVMILTGYIGEQQIAANGTVLVGARLLWGAISTVAYLFIPFILFTRVRPFEGRATPEARWAFRLLALATVTTWGVYPIGYMLPALLPSFNLNWINIVFSIFDVINKVGAGVIVYLAASQVLEERVPESATAPVRQVA